MTIPVVLTDAQAATVATRADALVLEGARIHARGIEAPDLGIVRFARPVAISPWPSRIRLVRTAEHYAIEHTARSFASVITPLRLILTAMTVLAGAVVLSALTTSDRTWWMDAFSRLGVFDDLSSALFNGGLITAGVVACVFAHRLWFDLARLHRRGMPRAAGLIVPGLCALAGVAISMVGVFPESGNRALHEVAALALAASFASLVMSAPWLLRRTSRVVHVVTWASAAIMAAAVALFAGGALTLAAFELVMFGLFFLWLCTVSAAVERARRARG